MINIKFKFNQTNIRANIFSKWELLKITTSALECQTLLSSAIVEKSKIMKLKHLDEKW